MSRKARKRPRTKKKSGGNRGEERGKRGPGRPNYAHQPEMRNLPKAEEEALLSAVAKLFKFENGEPIHMTSDSVRELVRSDNDRWLDPRPFSELSGRPPSNEAFALPDDGTKFDRDELARSLTLLLDVFHAAIHRKRVVSELLPFEVELLETVSAAVRRYERLRAERREMGRRGALTHELSEIYASVVECWPRRRPGEAAHQEAQQQTAEQREVLALATLRIVEVLDRHTGLGAEEARVAATKLTISGTKVRDLGGAAKAAIEMLSAVLEEDATKLRYARAHSSYRELTLLRESGERFVPKGEDREHRQLEAAKFAAELVARTERRLGKREKNQAVGAPPATNPGS